MRRETRLEGDLEQGTLKADLSDYIKQFRQQHTLNESQKIEPLLNGVFELKNLSDTQKELIYNDCINNVDLYFYLSKDVFIDVLRHSSDLKKLRAKIVAGDEIIKLPTVPKITKNLKKILEIRHQAMVIRYIDYLTALLK